jgi:hypothetical protein
MFTCISALDSIFLHSAFPKTDENYELDEEESATRSPLNYGEAAIVLPGTGGNEDQVSRFF